MLLPVLQMAEIVSKWTMNILDNFVLKLKLSMGRRTQIKFWSPPTNLTGPSR